METKQVVLQSKGAAFQVLRRGLMFARTFRSIINSQMGTDINSLSEIFYLVCQVLKLLKQRNSVFAHGEHLQPKARGD